MNKFAENFNRKVNCKAKILFENIFTGKSIYFVDALEPIVDDTRIGVRVHNNDIFLYKKDIKLYKNYENLFIFADDYMTITVSVNKL